MLEIVVCMKQVPDASEVAIDPTTGTLLRAGADAKTNLYDLYALDLAVTLKEQYGGRVTVLSMGPPPARSLITEAYALGADRGFLLSDRCFAGADTLATAFTLGQAVRRLPAWDIILTGMQSSDGDTAQVGPALAEVLGIPHVAYLNKVFALVEGQMLVSADNGDTIDTLQVQLPALFTCNKQVGQPKLPSFLLKQATKERPVEVWTAADLAEVVEAEAAAKPGAATTCFGLDGSPTKVEKVFAPELNSRRELWAGEPATLAERLYTRLRELKVV